MIVGFFIVSFQSNLLPDFLAVHFSSKNLIFLLNEKNFNWYSAIYCDFWMHFCIKIYNRIQEENLNYIPSLGYSLNCILILCMLYTSPRSTFHHVILILLFALMSLVLIHVDGFLSTAYSAPYMPGMMSYWVANLLYDKSSIKKI